MKINGAALLCCGLAAAAAWGQSDPPAGSEASPMEAFAGTQGVRSTWSNEIARWDQDASA